MFVRRPDKSSSDEKSESSVVHSFLQWQTNSGGGEALCCAGSSGGPASASGAAWAGTPRGLLSSPKSCAERKRVSGHMKSESRVSRHEKRTHGWSCEAIIRSAVLCTTAAAASIERARSCVTYAPPGTLSG